MAKAAIFKYKSKLPRTLFNKVLDYLIYSYNQMISNNVKYSERFCRDSTTYAFEDFLKWNFVKSYLQNEKNKKNSGIKEIFYLTFQFETEKEYIKDEILRRDKIDIFVSSLGLNTSWNNEAKEDHYFAFECKRLKNKEKNNLYISDIEKFANRDYWQTGFRFPYYGLIAFVEKSKLSINDIVSDIEVRILNKDNLNPVKKDATVFYNCISNDFPYCKLSKYHHNSVPIIIKIYHLFFDYSQIIIE